MASKRLSPKGRGVALFSVKAFHSLAFFVIQSAVLYLLYKGLRRETDRSAAIAAAIAGGETLIYVGNGFRCPLTGVAEELGAEKGSVTDIFLPSWLAANIARIYGPLFVLALLLHLSNLRTRRQILAR
jgi:hypothetical protein